MLGQQVGNYRVTAQLGEGGMGVVYLAEHTMIGRKAAIKVLLPEYSHKQAIVERFFNEARAATAIKHPGIVEIYDFGYLPDQSAYIVMEYLEGQSLEDRVRSAAPMPAAAVYPIARQMAAALHAAHQAGIIHRDLKPDNVFLLPDPENPGRERVRLLDFGIAKLSDQARAPGTSKTRTGVVMGTPSYMSPEQCRGAGKVDARADLYSLGCILYEMLCGRAPFVGEGAGEVMAAHIYAEAPAPSSLVAGIPPAFEQVVQRLLAKEPEHRFGSAQELVTALDHAISAGGGVRLATGEQTVMAPAAAQYGTAPPFTQPPQRTEQTTLGGAAAQHIAGPAATQPPARSGARWIAPAVVAVLLAAGGGIFALTQGGGDGDSVAAAETEDPEESPEETPEENPDEASRRNEEGKTLFASGDYAGAAEQFRQAAALDPQPRYYFNLCSALDLLRDYEGALASCQQVHGLDPDASLKTMTDDRISAIRDKMNVEITVRTSPTGAEVYRKADGLRVGETPYTVTMRPTAADLVLILKRDGYEDETVTVRADESSMAVIELAKKSRSHRSRTRTTASRTRTPENNTPQKTGRETGTPEKGGTETTSSGDSGRLNPFDRKGSDKPDKLNPFDK